MSPKLRRVNLMDIEKQRTLLKVMRRGTLLTALGVALYLGFRFDMVTLPQVGCSPVSRYSPGSRLLVDRRPPFWSLGDCVFVSGADGLVHLVLLGSKSPEGEFWVETDMPDCPGADSALLGWLKPSELLGRVVMGLGR